MNVPLPQVVALVLVLVGLGLAVSNALAGDPLTAFLWAVVAGVGIVYFQRFRDAGPARV